MKFSNHVYRFLFLSTELRDALGLTCSLLAVAQENMSETWMLIDMVWAMLSTGRSMQQLHWQTYEQPASPFRDEPAWSLGAWSHLTMHHARLDSPSSMQSAIHWVLKSWSSSWQVWTFFSFQSSVGILLLNLFFLQTHLFSDLKPPLCGSTQSFSFPVGASWLAQYYIVLQSLNI